MSEWIPVVVIEDEKLVRTTLQQGRTGDLAQALEIGTEDDIRKSTNFKNLGQIHNKT